MTALFIARFLLLCCINIFCSRAVNQSSWNIQFGDVLRPTLPAVDGGNWTADIDKYTYVPYKFDWSLNDWEKELLGWSMKYIEFGSRVRFTHYRWNDFIYLNFQASREPKLCAAPQGHWNGRTTVLINGDVCNCRGRMLHLLLHCLNLRHEHNRSDRDDHILVYKGHSDYTNLFDIDELIQIENYPYDLYSIMHFSPYSHANSTHPTFMVKPMGVAIELDHERTLMSQCDWRRLNAIYSPSTEPLPPTECILDVPDYIKPAPNRNSQEEPIFDEIACRYGSCTQVESGECIITSQSGLPDSLLQPVNSICDKFYSIEPVSRSSTECRENCFTCLQKRGLRNIEVCMRKARFCKMHGSFANATSWLISLVLTISLTQS